jgi:hypothetical protein
MWSINSMLGTGTRGSAIITTALSVLTYAIAFGIMHRNGNAEVVAAATRGYQALEIAFSPRAKTPARKDGAVMESPRVACTDSGNDRDEQKDMAGRIQPVTKHRDQ